MADEKARLRAHAELEAELGGLRRTVMGKPLPLPAVGTVLPGVVRGNGRAGCFATLETFGAGFIHMSEMSRRIVITCAEARPMRRSARSRLQSGRRLAAARGARESHARVRAAHRDQGLG